MSENTCKLYIVEINFVDCVDWNTLSKSFQLEYIKDYFLSTYPLIHCIIKKELQLPSFVISRPADFIVHEINEQMEIAGEVNQTIPEQPAIVEVENENTDDKIESNI